MYESQPKAREGKPLESVVPAAIKSTASTDGEQAEVGAVRGHAPRAASARSPLAFAAVAALAVIEALVILLLIAV